MTSSPRVRPGHSGTGPGPITPDGCAVEMYLRMPPGNEPEVIRGALPPGASVLELGCGVGRVTHPLVAHGFRVTAVDESPEMLAHVRGARTICSPIEELTGHGPTAGERFDCVLLGSFLVNTAEPATRRALLEVCRRHVADDGCVLIQREGENWYRDVPRESRLGDALVRVVSAEPAGPELYSVHVEYVFPDAVWTQTFRTRRLDDAAFEAALAEAGLAPAGRLTEDRIWVRARPVTA
ncbi:class I SAM-dependent methyltransferase [Streptomyces aidingensis]|uniref:Methyltransferase domain-containing protein n=1 Tax=Streptomyces aidingensis TaxID=910347 RepID=A0A1I1PJI3_9ACTN|nr:class I SAM-dependent methyltransferase [Streptomyces aidingensis]SFD06170.1 Methyltransferase domain-containing protein [Streptomyces aidingensis]